MAVLSGYAKELTVNERSCEAYPPAPRRFLPKAVAAVGIAIGLVSLGVNSAQAGGKTTVIDVHVSNCEGCVFEAHYGRNYFKAWDVVARSTAVSGGRATLTVPRAKTSLMSFEVISPEGYSAENAHAFVKMNDRKLFSHCWFARPGRHAHLNFRVKTYRARNDQGYGMKTFIAAWRASVQRPGHGVGINGSPMCERPSSA